MYACNQIHTCWYRKLLQSLQAVDPGVNGELVVGVSTPHDHHIPGHHVVVHHQPPLPQPVVVAQWQPFIFMHPAADFNQMVRKPTCSQCYQLLQEQVFI